MLILSLEAGIIHRVHPPVSTTNLLFQMSILYVLILSHNVQASVFQYYGLMKLFMDIFFSVFQLQFEPLAFLPFECLQIQKDSVGLGLNNSHLNSQ